MIAAWRARKAARPGTRRPRRSQRPATWRVGASTQRRQVPPISRTQLQASLRGPFANLRISDLAAPWPRRHAAPSGRLCRQPQPLGRRRRAACGHWSLACICARPLARRLCVPAYPTDEIAPGVVAAGNNFKVVVRVRPPLPRELSGDKRFQNIARIDRDRTITLCENLVRPASGSCVTL